MITEEQLTHFKQALLQEKARIENERVSYSGGAATEAMNDEPGDLSDYDPNDIGDEGSNLYDRDRNAAAIDNFDRLLKKINRALQKIDEGTYGLSDVDGRPIPIERLEALPYALATVDQETEAL